MPHDTRKGERLAGWTHLAFAVLYAAAFIWHVKATKEHWNRFSLGEEIRHGGFPERWSEHEYLVD